MLEQEFIKKLVVKNEKKIVLLVADGLGGLPHPELKKTELEISKHEYLDELASKSDCGLHEPVFPGITPGSGPAHLGIFGYNPLKYEIGRGLLDSLGIDFGFQPGDLAARGNYATSDENGIITDRRAGRISTDINIKLSKLLDGVELDGVKAFVLPVKEHRFAVVFRPSPGKILSDKISDSDPQKEGLKALCSNPFSEESNFSAFVVNKFIEMANRKLKDSHPANSILLRGFANMLDIPSFSEIYQLKSLCIAAYPMYKGLSRLVGMDVINGCDTVKGEFDALKSNFEKYDFFFVHIKGTDSAGEDGDFARKVKVIEELDLYIPEVLDLKPDVLVVTGDHSTPSLMHGHSWHSVPLMIYSKFSRFNLEVKRFTENDCLKGSLGRINSQSIMTIALSSAQKLAKYGA